MILDGRHYVTRREGRGRNFLVIRTNATTSRGRHLKLSYSVVSRHWTWKGAQRVAHRLNAQEGIAH